MNISEPVNVLIIGCGWLGKKTGQRLSEYGCTVYGTTRSVENFPELENHSIRPLQFEITDEHFDPSGLPDFDVCLISLSPGRGEGRAKYPSLISKLAGWLQNKTGQIMLFSSTSVYKGLKGTLTEEMAEPGTESDNVLLAAEGEIRKYIPDALILRFGGLYGEDRHPVKYLAGRKGLGDGDAPVNLIHRQDIIEIIAGLIEKNVRAEVLNICCDKHPSRAHLYTTLANRFGLEEPVFREGGAEGKLISSEKVKKLLNYTFNHPDPMDYSGYISDG